MRVPLATIKSPGGPKNGGGGVVQFSTPVLPHLGSEMSYRRRQHGIHF